jgi:phosphotransferase system HPr (HPr) family protein
MCQRTVNVIDADGLHMRVCMEIVHVAGGCDCDVKIRHGQQVADGTSILELLLLAAPCGTELMISAQGPDADRVMEMLVDLLLSPPDDAGADS